jgi:hypothetical protein
MTPLKKNERTGRIVQNGTGGFHMLFKRTSYILAIVLIALAGLVSCEREMEPLAPAPFPTDAEVFIDGFGPSIEPQSFLGSKLDALQTTETETYAGSQAIEITVPAPGDASGSTWAGGALVAAAARDLSGYTALTFWAKASKTITLNTMGIGNDNEGPGTYVAERINVPLTTSWAKFVIPIPLADKLQQEKGMFYYSEGQEDGEGATIWLDEMKFENLGTIAYPSVSFSSNTLNVYQNSIISIPSVSISFDVSGAPVSVLASASYLTFTSSDSSIVTVNEDGSLTALGLGSAEITAKLGDLDVPDMITITVGEAPPLPETAAPVPLLDAADVLSIYSDSYTSVTTPDFYTYWEYSTAEVQELNIVGNPTMQFLNLNFAGIDFSSQVINASSMTHFHMDAWTPDPSEAPNSFKILLVDFGADGVVGGTDNSSHELSITAATTPALATDEWMSLDIPLSDFTGLTTKGHIGQLVISGEVNSVYIDNIYFYDNGEAPPPPVGGGPAAPATPPTVPADSVISLFSNAYTDVNVDSWATGWEFSTTVLQDIQIAGDDVKLYTNLNFNGIEFTSNPVDASDMNRFHMDIWTPDETASPATFNVKLVDFGANGTYAGGDDTEHELIFTANTSPALATGSWVSLDLPLSAFTGLTTKSNLAQMIISGSDGLDSVYVDNVYFYYQSEGGGGGSDSGPTEPADTPVVPADSVISLFSNAYTKVAVDSWATGWEFSTTVLEETTIAGNDVLLYTELNFNGIEFTTQQIDATDMNRFHMDIWTPDETASPATFNVKLVDFGANGSYDGGDDTEHEISFTASTSPALVTGSWVSIDVPMSAFVGLTTRANLAQMIISGSEGLNTVYVDNIYFYYESIGGGGSATEPETPAPTPSHAATDVISLYSDAYTNVTVDTWSAEWDNADVATLQIDGNNTRLYTNLIFCGIEFTSQTVDATAMTHFSFDMWTPNSTESPAIFKVKLVDFGADGAWSGGDDVEHELTYTATSSPSLATGSWVSFDIPLTDFTALTTTGHMAQLIYSGDLSTVYLDNILFHR